MIEVTVSEKVASNLIRFCTLSQLTQAMVNIIIVSGNQEQIVQKVLKANLIEKLMQILLNITPDVLNFKKTHRPSKDNFRHFIGFIAQSFRFLIVCQSVDHKCLSSDP